MTVKTAPEQYDTDVCIVGGGPAGMMLGLLLARAGVGVTVMEKHADFLRDFRGDTVHPSTVNALDQIGLGTALLALKHRKVSHLDVNFSDGRFRVADFGRLSSAHPYIVFLPQWDLLDLLATEAGKYSRFSLLRSTEAVDLIRDGGRVTGAVGRDHGGNAMVEVRAKLTVAADGRYSAVRELLGLVPEELGAPMDVLWFRLPRLDSDSDGLDMHVGGGGLLLLIDRGDYWQVALVIRKGGHEAVVDAGLDAFRKSVASRVPMLGDRAGTIKSLDDVKMLSVSLNRLKEWHAPGVLLIGDAAHAMSPIGGVGINLAVQDAIATANIIAGPLKAGTLNDSHLAAVARRRLWPTRVTQTIQRIAQRRFVEKMLDASTEVRAPAVLRVMQKIPQLQALPARLIGIGVRPETPATNEESDLRPGAVTG